MKNYLKKKLSFNKFLIGIFILFFLITLGGFGKILWQYKNLSEQNIAILSPGAIASGGSAELQIYAWNVHNNEKIEKGDIRIELLDGAGGKIAELYAGDLINGSASARIILPELAEGQYALKATLKSESGKDEILKTINIKTQSKIFISTDRPLYQPGQTMNFRALVLGSGNLKPAAGKEVIVSVNNPKGDTVFRQSYTSSEYGIIGGQFGFASELAFGDYMITVAAEGQAADKTVAVKQFTLPKFEVKIEPDQDLSVKPAGITGHVEAKYFFGKPVIGANAEISLFIDDKKMSASVSTDSSGLADFRFMPNYQGDPKTIRLEASVSVENGEAVSQQKSYSVIVGGILVELIPESGKLKPGLDNRILLISSKPDGTPLKTTIFMTGEKLREFATDEFGLASFTYRPEKNSSISRFTLNVRGEDGNALVKTFELQNEINDAGHLILRTGKTILADGENLTIEILGTNDADTRIEFIQSGQVVYGETVKLENGAILKNIELPKTLFGTVEARAMQIFYDPPAYGNYNQRQRTGRDKVRIAADSKFILVDRSNNLSIRIEKDKNNYRPGEEAHLTFVVTNDAGEPENSALGVKIVDEALLALATDDSFSRRLILVNEKIAASAKPVNGLDWQKAVEDDTLAARDQILAAMFRDVPREQSSLSETIKDNKTAWQSFEKNKKTKLQSLLWFFFFGFLFFNLKLWWRLSGAAVKQKAGLKLWGGSLLVFIFSTYAISLFMDNYYYSIWDRFGEVFGAIGDNFWKTIIDFPYTYLGIIVFLIGAGYSAWKYRPWLKAYWPIVMSYLAVLVALLFMSVAYKLDLGLSEEIWVITLFIGFISLFAGLSGLMAVFYLNKQEFTVASWLFVILTGTVFFFVSPAIIPFYIVLIIFSAIRKSMDHEDKEVENIVDKIERLKNQLAAQGKDEKQVELEIALLRRELEESDGYSTVGRVVVAIITLIGILYLAGMGVAIIGGLWHEFAWHPVSSAYAQTAADDVIWEGLESNVQIATGLGNTDPRQMASSVIKAVLGFAGMLASILMVWGGLRWLARPKEKNVRRQAKIMLIVGTFGMIVTLATLGVSQFVIGALYSATGATDGGGVGFSAPGFSAGSGPRESDSMLWGGFESSVQSTTGLGNTDTRSMVADLIPDFGFKNTNDQAVPAIKENAINIGGDEREEVGYKEAGRVRNFFPETMFWQTELIAGNGRAELSVPVSDSITRWKLSALANSLSGKIGAGEDSLIAFQDFFLDFDLPFNLTRGDELVLPVSLFNYLSVEQKIILKVREDPWFTLLTENNREFALGAGEVRTVYLKLKIESYGDFNLRVDVQGTKTSDAVEKSVKILPFGQRITQTIASEEFKENKSEYQALLPEDRITGTEKISLKIFPSVLSEVISGLESILRFPSGCFEQTSSGLYPDILVLKYLQGSGRENPEIRKKAEDFINQGVQKLLTYEIEPGGFSYFGHAPAETILSAYGLMEFSEMRGVTFVDEDLINRTREFVYKKQNYNGAFAITGSHGGGFSGGNELAKNAYIVWALSESDPEEKRLEKSINYLGNNLDELKKSPYALALAANAFINHNAGSAYAKEALAALKQTIEVDGDGRAHIALKEPNHYGSYGRYGNVEVTALSAIAFARIGERDFSDKLNDYIIASRDGRGTWGSTQATILALKSLVVKESDGQKIKDNEGSVRIVFNGQEEKRLKINPENSEVAQFLEFADNLGGVNTINIEKDGKVRVTLQIVKDYYQEWPQGETAESGSLSIDRRYGTSRRSGTVRLINQFGVGEQASLYVIMTSNSSVKNAVAEIPIPAGFIVDTASLECQVKNNKNNADCPTYYANSRYGANRYENKGERIILYFDEFTNKESRVIEIPITPRYQGVFKIMPARFYAYYDPGQEDFSQAINNIGVGEKMITGDVLLIPGLTNLTTTPVSPQFLPTTPSSLGNTCRDSDGGKNYYISSLTIGKLNGIGVAYNDDCPTTGQPHTLIEYYCENNMLKSENYICPNGCAQGRCLSICQDTDNGQDYYTPGSCSDTVHSNIISDTCRTADIMEMYCDTNNSCQRRYVKCPNGCSDGACVR